MGQSANAGCSFGSLHLCQSDANQGSGGLVLSSGTCGGSHSLGRVGKAYSIDASNEGRYAGSSSFSTVFRAVHRSSSDTRILRVVAKRVCERERLTRELDVLRGLDHPNLVKVLEVWEDHRAICILLEPVPGYDLLTAVGTSGLLLSELLMAQLTRQLLLGLQQLHSAGLAHEDVQPRNILASEGVLPGQDLRIKLVDYGLATKYATASCTDRPPTCAALQCCNCLAPEQAPELPPRSRVSFGDPSVDIWAVGAITFLLLSGHWPIEAATPSALRKKLRTGLWGFQPPEAWSGVSSSAKAFVSALLVTDSGKRADTEQALGHVFLRHDSVQKGAAKPFLRQRELAASFCRLGGLWALQQAAVNAAATQLSGAQIVVFQRLFGADDVGMEARVPFSELRQKLMTAGVQLPGRHLGALLAVDDDPNCKISGQQVMLAAAERRRGLEEAVLWAAWTAATADGATSVNRTELPSIFEHIGPSLRELFCVSAIEAAELAGCGTADTPGTMAGGLVSDTLQARVSHDDLLDWCRSTATAVSSRTLRFGETCPPVTPLLRLPAPTDNR